VVLFADNCDALCTTYLKPMADAEISSQIQDWSIGGGLFFDYCDLLHSFAAYNEVSLQYFSRHFGFLVVSMVFK